MISRHVLLLILLRIILLFLLILVWRWLILLLSIYTLILMNTLILMICRRSFLPFLFWLEMIYFLYSRFVRIVWRRWLLAPFFFLIAIIFICCNRIIINTIGYFLTIYSLLLSNLMIIKFYQIRKMFNDNLTIVLDLNLER